MHEFRPLRNKEQYLASPLSLLIYASLCPTFYSLFLRFGFPCVAPRFCICTMSAGIQLEHYSERDHEILGGRGMANTFPISFFPRSGYLPTGTY